MLIFTIVFYLVAAVTADTEKTKGGKQLSIFNVVRFPNENCVGAGSLNGTCYTASECTSLSGTASGGCASSFGVCCVFSLSCGATTSANTSYAQISSFSTTSDTDPCTYTYCKNNEDICKLRIDYESMVLAGPETTDTTYINGINMGRCNTDTLTVAVPGYNPPPIVCGYNTGQHMWVPASDDCVTINIDVDTATSGTTRSWNIKVSQFECGNLRAPEENCLQYHTATSGTIASFNYDTTKTSNLKTELYTQYHLADQYYDICIRRARSNCAVCYSPEVIHSATAGTTEGSSFGVSAASEAAPTFSVNQGVTCTGFTTVAAIDTNSAGLGDYITIDNAQNGVGAATTLGTDRICGILWSADGIATTATATVCSYRTPWRIGVHFDAIEAIGATPTTDGDNLSKTENAQEDPATTSNGAGVGYMGFWLNYWQLAC